MTKKLDKMQFFDLTILVLSHRHLKSSAVKIWCFCELKCDLFFLHEEIDGFGFRLNLNILLEFWQSFFNFLGYPSVYQNTCTLLSITYIAYRKCVVVGRTNQTWLLNWNGPNAPHKKLKNLHKISSAPYFFLDLVKIFL